MQKSQKWRDNRIVKFWSLFKKESGCWIFSGSHESNGYGLFGGKTWLPERLTHRLSWHLTNGPIPKGMSVLHKCDNPPCGNPDHLFLGTRADNVADMVSKNRHARGLTSGTARLTENQVAAIRLIGQFGKSQRWIANKFGISRSKAHGILNRLQWKHIA